MVRELEIQADEHNKLITEAVERFGVENRLHELQKACAGFIRSSVEMIGDDGSERTAGKYHECISRLARLALGVEQVVAAFPELEFERSFAGHQTELRLAIDARREKLAFAKAKGIK